MASRLLAAIIAKTFIELLVVCGLATLAAFTNHAPIVRGSIDAVDRHHISGWAYDPLSPEETITVQLFIDDRLILSKQANGKRSDLVDAGVTVNPTHGFTFQFDSLHLPPGTHRIQIYALCKTSAGKKVLVPISKRVKR